MKKLLILTYISLSLIRLTPDTLVQEDGDWQLWNICSGWQHMSLFCNIILCITHVELKTRETQKITDES